MFTNPRDSLPFIRRKHRKKDLASPRFLSARLWTIIAADAAMLSDCIFPILPSVLPFHPTLSASFLEALFFLPSSFFVPANCSGCKAFLRATTGQPRRHASGKRRDSTEIFNMARRERVEIFVAVVLLQSLGGPSSTGIVV